MLSLPRHLDAWGRNHAGRGLAKMLGWEWGTWKLADTCFAAAVSSISKEKEEQIFLPLFSPPFYVCWPRPYNAYHVSVPSCICTLCHASSQTQWLHLFLQRLLAQVLWGFLNFPFSGCQAMRIQSSWKIWNVAVFSVHLPVAKGHDFVRNLEDWDIKQILLSLQHTGNFVFKSPKLMKLQV